MLLWLVLMISLSQADAKAAGFVNKFRIPHDGIKQLPDVTSYLPQQPYYHMDSISKPDFCHELDCPSFTVIKKTKDYELRSYVATGWVSTSLTDVDFAAAEMLMFNKLFKYISGKNAKKQKIAMTAPVLISVIPGPGPACENNFTMSFYMSTSVTDPPAPTDETVSLNNLPQQQVYVRSFGGFATKMSWLKNAEELANALVNDSQPFNQDYFYSAGYDSPFKILGRHNEVWYIAKK